MKGKESSPKVKLADRVARNKKDYERLVKQLESTLHHHSPGIWDWLEDTFEDIGDTLGDGWDAFSGWLNDIGDTASSAAEDARDQVTDFLHLDEINAMIEHDKAMSELEGNNWSDLDTAGAYAGAIKGIITSELEDLVEPVKQQIAKVTYPITSAVSGFAGNITNIINDIKLGLGIGFEAAMTAITGLPALLATWKTELTDWFTFDFEEYRQTMEVVKNATQALPPRDVEEY